MRGIDKEYVELLNSKTNGLFYTPHILIICNILNSKLNAISSRPALKWVFKMVYICLSNQSILSFVISSSTPSSSFMLILICHPIYDFSIWLTRLDNRFNLRSVHNFIDYIALLIKISQQISTYIWEVLIGIYFLHRWWFCRLWQPIFEILIFFLELHI